MLQKMFYSTPYEGINPNWDMKAYTSQNDFYGS